jgi:hypothetical protein
MTQNLQSESLHHDCSWALASALAELLAELLPDDERRKFFDSSYQASRACLDAFCARVERQAKRINPTEG